MEMANYQTPVIVAKSSKEPDVRIYDGFHRLASILIYCKYKKLTEFEKDAYYGTY